MTTRPAIMGLLLADAVVVVFLGYAALLAWRVARYWDPQSGSARQLRLERRSQLISTLLTFALFTELLTLLLFVFNADRMADFFVGAMCAVGSLNADPYGFPALILRLALFFGAATWLVMSHLDGQHPQAPLTRPKYLLLLGLFPLAATAAGVQLRYFLGLDWDSGATITSCCGGLFSVDAKSVASELSGLPPLASMAAFYLTMTAAVTGGAWVAWSQRGWLPYAGIAALAFAVGVAGVISFVSLYVYEHPHHHCPFCLLKPEYGYFGYLLYAPLFGATALALGAGASAPFAKQAGLADLMALHGRRLVLGASVLFALFTVIATWAVVRSHLILIEGLP